MEEKINAVTQLGFDRDAAMQALEICGNDVEQAVNYLITTLT